MRKYLLATALGFSLLYFGFVLGIRYQKTIIPEILPSKTDYLASPLLATNHTGQLDEVVKVVDGDTIDVMTLGKIERLRLIGINTPETVDPRKPVECFGKEASEKARLILSGKRVILENDPTQGERDKYNRLLRYIFLEDGTNFNFLMIREGFAYEYTYDLPYKYQMEFKQAQKHAEENKAGLWGAQCANHTYTVITPVGNASSSCAIKGNINMKKEKIYHVPSCGSYDKTVIDESVGEKWFCSEQDALNAGWRKALNC